MNSTTATTATKAKEDAAAAANAKVLKKKNMEMLMKEMKCSRSHAGIALLRNKYDVDGARQWISTRQCVKEKSVTNTDVYKNMKALEVHEALMCAVKKEWDENGPTAALKLLRDGQ